MAFHTIAILGQTVGIALEVHRSIGASRSRSCERQAHFRGGQKMSLSTAQEHFKTAQRLARDVKMSVEKKERRRRLQLMAWREEEDKKIPRAQTVPICAIGSSRRREKRENRRSRGVNRFAKEEEARRTARY